MMLSSHERYRCDPLFKMIVDMLVAQLNQSEFTPTELREAVIVAACIHEQTNCRRVVLTEQENGIIRDAEISRLREALKGFESDIRNEVVQDLMIQQALDTAGVEGSVPPQKIIAAITRDLSAEQLQKINEIRKNVLADVCKKNKDVCDQKESSLHSKKYKALADGV